MEALRVWYFAASVSTLAFSFQLTWRRDKAFDGVLPVGIDMGSTVSTGSLLACAARCSEVQWCNTFFYNDDSKDCLRQRMVYDIPGGAQYVSDRLSGFHYRLDRDVTMTGGWFEGRQNCQKEGEDLSVLEPVIKADFVTQFLLANSDGLQLTRDIHIGAKRPNPMAAFPASGPDYRWVNGQTLNMTVTDRFWSPRHPVFFSHKGTVRMYIGLNFTWREATHTWGKRYSLCEKPFVLD